MGATGAMGRCVNAPLIIRTPRGFWRAKDAIISIIIRIVLWLVQTLMMVISLALRHPWAIYDGMSLNLYYDNRRALQIGCTGLRRVASRHVPGLHDHMPSYLDGPEQKKTCFIWRLTR